MFVRSSIFSLGLILFSCPTISISQTKEKDGRSGPTGEFKSAPKSPESSSPSISTPLPMPVPRNPNPAPATAAGEIPEFPPGALSIGIVDSDENAELPARFEKMAKEGAGAMAGKEYVKARDIYEQMVAALPSNELARANLGMAEYRLKNYPAAREQFNSAVALNPRVSQNWVTLGLVHFREKNLEMAISSLTRAIALNPQDAKAHLYLGVVIGQYGWGDAAEKEMRRSVQLDASDPDAHFNLGLLYLRKTPAAVELAKRHYYTAIDLGAKPDPQIAAEIKAAELKASQSTN